jgi:hypothetical protein
VVEEVLRTHRDQALALLRENRAQSREGIEILVKSRLREIAAAARPGMEALPADGMEDLYREVLDLAFVMFALGYTMAHMIPKEQVR